MIEEYKVLESDYAYGLDAEVNHYIREGWQPQGDIQVIPPVGQSDGVYLSSAKYVQVMVRMSPAIVTQMPHSGPEDRDTEE